MFISINTYFTVHECICVFIYQYLVFIYWTLDWEIIILQFNMFRLVVRVDRLLTLNPGINHLHKIIFRKDETQPFRNGYFDDKSYKSFVHDLHTTISNEETFLQDFLAILKYSWKKSLLGCIWMVMCLANLVSHTGVLSDAKC